tara:strand:+ start:684 stop:935 length:252 start_codon:yes stop_codon:yes gene_type:complete
LEKINEIVLGIIGLFVAMSGWIIRRLFRSVDKAHARISVLEKNLVDRAYLESQLAPIRQDLNLILSHLLEHRKTEKEKTHLKD